MANERGTRDTTPVILTSGTTPLAILVAGGIAGPPVLLPTLDLMNTLRVPIEVTELHFSTDEPQGNFGILDLALELSLSAGRYMISRYCPLVALGVRRDSDVHETTNVSLISGHQVRWILPKPLILAPNEGFSGAIRMSPNLSPFAANGTVNFTMTARARRLPLGSQVPAVRSVPYASGWIFSPANIAIPAPDTTFQNIHKSILHVSSINSSRIFASTQDGGTVTITAPGGLANTVMRNMALGVNRQSIFGQRSALEVSHDLEPNEFYGIVPSGTLNGVGIAIDLIGCREE